MYQVCSYRRNVESEPGRVDTRDVPHAVNEAHSQKRFETLPCVVKCSRGRWSAAGTELGLWKIYFRKQPKHCFIYWHVESAFPTHALLEGGVGQQKSQHVLGDSHQGRVTSFVTRNNRSRPAARKFLVNSSGVKRGRFLQQLRRFRKKPPTGRQQQALPPARTRRLVLMVTTS